MDAPLHHAHVAAVNSAEYEVALVADGGGYGDTGDVAVRHNFRILDIIGYGAETTAKHNAYFGLEITNKALDIIQGLGKLIHNSV